MSAPTNVSAETATALAAAPSSATQTVDESGTTYTVWYRYTAQPTDVVISLFGFGDLTTYTPTTTVWIGPAASPVAYLGGVGGVNKPCQFPVDSGVTYYFKVQPNGGNPSPASLTISVQASPVNIVPAGSLFVNDDTTGFPAMTVDASSGAVNGAVRAIVAGETGDLSNDGSVVLLNNDDGAALTVYTGGLALTGTLAFNADRGVRLNPTSNTFYVAHGATHAVTTVTSAGVLGGTTWTVTGQNGPVAANTTDTILAYSKGGSGAAVSRWDLVNNVALTDLVAGITGYFIADILTAASGGFTVLYYKGTATTDAMVKHYSSTGTVLSTLALGTQGANTPKLAYADTSLETYWVWFHALTPAGFSTFKRVRQSDNTILTTLTVPEYEDGVYKPAASATPTRFGVSQSCPFVMLRQKVSNLPVPSLPAVTIVPIRRVRRSPHVFESNKRIFLSRLEPYLRTGIGTTSGQGIDAEVMLRVSKDGGYTWGAERVLSAGALGRYATRLQAYQFGVARDWVFEITVSDPNVPWTLLDLFADIEEGTS